MADSREISLDNDLAAGSGKKAICLPGSLCLWGMQICYNIKVILVDFLYALFLVLTLPFWVRYLLKKKYRKMIKNRFVPAVSGFLDSTIWIHAVSVGEARSLKSLIRELTENHGQKVVLTVTTPSGYAFAKREYAEIPVIPAPIDFSFVIRRFVKAIHPKIILFNELELWPNWIYLANRLKIPMVLINGRISEIAFKKYAFFSHLAGRFLNRLDFLIVQTEMYRERFSHLKIPDERVIVSGNIKADEAIQSAADLPSRNEVLDSLQLSGETRKIAVVASSHRSDEKLFLKIVPKIMDRFFCILVPRHPERADEVADALTQAGLQFRILSRNESSGDSPDILLIDRLGCLFEILSIADVVFMGGTCQRRVGGHNLYEPAALGKWIIGGPHFQNFSDIGNALQKKGVYCLVNGPNELLTAFSHFSDLNMQQVRMAAIAEVEKRKGSVLCIIRQIQRLVRL